MNYFRLFFLAALLAVGTSPAFAQHGHAAGGMGAGASGSHGGGMGNESANSNSSGHTNSNMMNSAPADVLNHNTVIAGKIKTLTGQEASTACGGFKNLGQCVAAAHVAKNLNIPGGFNALKAKMTGTGSVSLGKAIEQLAPSANAKAESKKANKQAEQDIQESTTA